jgi:hypothetical protein
MYYGDIYEITQDRIIDVISLYNMESYPITISISYKNVGVDREFKQDDFQNFNVINKKLIKLSFC